MPTYQYRCQECKQELEAVQSFADDPLKKCPACKKMKLAKVFSGVGISFKGNGFYKNDHGSSAKSKAKAKAAKSESSGNGSSSGSSDSNTKTETKSEKKTEKSSASSASSSN